MKKVNETIIAGVLILYANGEPATGKTVTAKVYDETYALFSQPTVSEITGTGVYYASFTPDAEGLWTIVFDCADPNVTRAYSWYVQEQIADDIDTLLDRLTSTRAGYLDNLPNLDVAVSTRSSHSATDVWAVATRNLTAQTFPFTNPGAPLDVTNIRTAAYTYLTNATYGLSALKTEIDANETKIDTVDTVVDAIKVQTDKLPRVVSHMDFWSDNDDEIALTTTTGADHNLPNCVVAGLPSGITIIRVVALLKIALIKDTSGADNAINGATALKVDAASDYSSTVTAINIPDNSWAVDVSEATERGGDVMIGDNDIKTEVTGNGTYYARLEDIVCDGNNLKLKDVAFGLRVYFTV